MEDTREKPVASRDHRRRAGFALVTVVAVVAVAFSSFASRSPRPQLTAAASQVIAAGASDTNLATESTLAGAQSPPYVCCWATNGQYVKFAFNVPGGTTNLVLRFSAGTAAAYRKILLDGAVWKPKQAFAKTASWSAWKTVTLSTPLIAGLHHLEVLYDTAAGSKQYMNLDNLTVVPTGVVQPPIPGVAVSLAYSDTALGVLPWSGSDNTVFIGTPPQCCLTYGPDVGKSGYDGGVIQIRNGTSNPIVVNAVTVDFDNGSSPSHFDLWGGGTAVHLPQTLPPAGQLILTMTSGFNFDTSDLFGEACILNSRAVGTVHVTVDGALTDYHDNHQILNRDGTDIVGCPGVAMEQVPYTIVSPGAQPAALPHKDIAPSIVGVTIAGRVLSGFGGGWNASPPPTLALQWTRCTSTGTSCVAIAGATGPTYRPVAADVGRRLRVQVTAANASGKTIASSAATALIQAGPAVGQFGNVSTGATSTFVYNTNQLGTIFQASASGTSTDFSFFARGAGNAQSFTPKVYSVVNGQPGSLLATGTTVTVPKVSKAKWYVSTLAGLSLHTGTQYMLALAPSGAYNGTYVGSETEGAGPMSFFLDYTP